LYSAKVKICGVRRLEDVRIVNAAKPDLIGFILTPSRRRVTPEEARILTGALDPSILRVGVFAAETVEEIADTAEYLRLNGVQIHMDTVPAFLTELEARLAKIPKDRRPSYGSAFRSRFRPDRERISAAESKDSPNFSRFDGLLLDTWKDKGDGGSGTVFHGSRKDFFLKKIRFRPRNSLSQAAWTKYVAQAVSFFRPYRGCVQPG
jgi:phosphoribosylanthranilate isomerase